MFDELVSENSRAVKEFSVARENWQEYLAKVLATIREKDLRVVYISGRLNSLNSIAIFAANIVKFRNFGTWVTILDVPEIGPSINYTFKIENIKSMVLSTSLDGKLQISFVVESFSRRFNW